VSDSRSNHPADTGPKVPLGFSFAGIAAGIKVKRKDLALILSAAPAAAAGCFTRSETRAASVRRGERLLPCGGVRAIVAASGNANAMTGPRAEQHDEAVARAIAAAIDVPPETVLTAATGVIGVPFPVEKVEAAAPRLVEALGSEPRPAAEAILTTDTVTKLASRELYLAGKRVRVLGVGKGSGMVHPNMATVLGFVLTDADVKPSVLAELLTSAVDESFNQLSVDHDTSTNDAVIALANGLSEAPRVTRAGSEAGRAIGAAIAEVCRELAIAVARDGEGARKLVTVEVRGADDRASARALARGVVASNLVKAALFGADPAAGRVLAAIGARAAELGLKLDPRDLDVRLQGVALFARGTPLPFDADAVRARLRSDAVTVEVVIGDGSHTASAWGCDLSYDYVRINADYAAVLVGSPGGPVHRDQRLETKTPELKTEVLVSALRYIERFAGKRAVIRYGQATIERRDLALRLAEDVRLLSAVGLRPILVQGGPSELVVTSLARAGVRAVGLSGADGNLLRRGSPATTGPRASRHSVPPLASEPSAFAVDPDVLETLLARGYIPVVMPDITEELESEPTPIDVDAVAADVAVACGAAKLIYLREAAGIASDGLLVSELSGEELAARVTSGAFDAATTSLAASVVRALAGGVDTVHLIDERVPHNVVAELFTDTGVGTMVR
jgi:acetylglutamate kinase